LEVSALTHSETVKIGVTMGTQLAPCSRAINEKS
jgi:hypothetical protein